MSWENRPTCVTVIAWIWGIIATTALLILVSAFIFALIEKVADLALYLTTFIATAIFAPILIASIQFLRLKSWARTALEITSWILFIVIPAQIVSSVYALFGESIFPEMDLFIGATMLGSITRLFFLGFLVAVILKALRSAKVRDVMGAPQRTYPEKFPTCMTVVSWSGIILGIDQLIVSIFSFPTIYLMPTTFYVETGISTTFFYAITGVILVASILSIIGGAHLLKLKIWARSLLEGLCWLALLLIISYAVFFQTLFFKDRFDILPYILFLALALPIFVILIYLRGTKIKTALGIR